MELLRIQTIRFGELKQKRANAIGWQIQNISRHAEEAVVHCGLIMFNDDDGSSEEIHTFDMVIPQAILSSWGTDDGVIDDFVLTYSPLFKKEV